jgi:hypothetical protein
LWAECGIHTIKRGDNSWAPEFVFFFIRRAAWRLLCKPHRPLKPEPRPLVFAAAGR